MVLSGKSTELQILNIYGSILKSKNEYMISDNTYIDMAKTLYKVSHSKLVLLPVVKQFKDLGITFCDNLSFNININMLKSIYTY